MRKSDSACDRPSFEDLRLRGEYEFAVSDEDASDDVSAVWSSSVSQKSIQSATRPTSVNLGSLPPEILDLIFSLITLDHAKDRYVDPKVDLFSCLLVSKSIHAAALPVLYRHVKIPQSKAFHKFNNGVLQIPQLGPLVQCLDFSHYSSIGFGRAKATNLQTPYLTPTTLKACLQHTPNLRSFLVHEHLDDELDVDVLSTLFGMPFMLAIDLCSCSSESFTKAFTSLCMSSSLLDGLSNTAFLELQRLSLHECTTLKAPVFESLLPKLRRLTHLDVAHTMINDTALMSIPTRARITHLNLERCTQVTGPSVVRFLTQHPAVKDSVIYLNLMADASRYRLLAEDDLDNLLPTLPDTLKSLNIGGSRVNSSHVTYLKVLATHLEELGLKGANLGLDRDITQILFPAASDVGKSNDGSEKTSSLRYVDLTDVKSVCKMSLNYSPVSIIGPESLPLEVIELGQSVLKDLDKSAKKLREPDWVVRELGRRGWYVRQKHLLPGGLATPDDGYRQWKMGARWWGMRKIPMFEQETGGMYGYFMFKRN